MSEKSENTLVVFAPAKINLYLHVVRRLENGYHELDSLVCFTDIGDEITIEPAEKFTFNVRGPYANAFDENERGPDLDSPNLVVRAAKAAARQLGRTPDFRITLTKNLPLASGIGGGSSDAAATLKGLLQYWGLPEKSIDFSVLMKNLGADVPVCFPAKSTILRGIGDILEPAPPLPATPVVLVNPGRPCITAGVFKAFSGPFKEPCQLPQKLDNFEGLVGFLKAQSNDLFETACEKLPEIAEVIKALENYEECALARMSGAGATCFGLFKNTEEAKKAAKKIAAQNPGWWIKAGTVL